MIPDFTSEISFRTARSGGAGGQNVNKVETMAEGFWPVAVSRFFIEAQKQTLAEKLGNRINKDGQLTVRSQIHRSQLANKEEVLRKIKTLVATALEKKKLRIASKPTKAAKEKRLSSKKKAAVIKSLRRERF